MAIGKLNADDIRFIAPNSPHAEREQIAAAAEECFEKFVLDTRLRRAHFLAQVAHESGQFVYREEKDWGGDNYAYLNGREDLGCKPGETNFGANHHGYGWIQTTGSYNQRIACEKLGLDFDKGEYKRLSEYPYCALSAGVFWADNDLNRLADRDDVEIVTRRVNGGLNGLGCRADHLLRAKQCYGIS